MACMISSMSAFLASFFIRTSRTITSDFLAISSEYRWVMCAGTTFKMNERCFMFWQRIRLIKTTKVSWIALTSYTVGRKAEGWREPKPFTEDLASGGDSIRLRTTSILSICCNSDRWSVLISLIPFFLSTLSPTNLNVTPSAIHCWSGTLCSLLTPVTAASVAL